MDEQLHRLKEQIVFPFVSSCSRDSILCPRSLAHQNIAKEFRSVFIAALYGCFSDRNCAFWN